MMTDFKRDIEAFHDQIMPRLIEGVWGFVFAGMALLVLRLYAQYRGWF